MSSTWSEAGIHVSLKQESPTQIYDSLGTCSNGNTSCTWEIANGSGPGATANYSPEYVRSPQSWLGTGGASNIEAYSDAKMDAIINAIDFDSAPSAVQYCRCSQPNTFPCCGSQVTSTNCR